MAKKQKLDLKDLKVQSFVTTLDGDLAEKARGGITTFALLGCSWGTGVCCDLDRDDLQPVPLKPQLPEQLDTNLLGACNSDSSCFA